MATPLKYMYHAAYFEKLCPVLERHIPDFDRKEFIFRIFNNQWPDLELKDRVRHISTALACFLPADFPSAVSILVTISKDLQNILPLQRFENIFLPDYVGLKGLHHPDQSLKALAQITTLVSAEFAVRPFIIRYPEKAMDHVYKWASSENHFLRRLSSEGCRPRLPWAMALMQFQKDPAPILPVISALKEDPSPYVRRSVANNLNDIGKDHPDIIIDLLRNWKGKNSHTDWILRHGCRALLKSGNRRALASHGFNPASKCRADTLSLPSYVNIGGQLDFTFDFVNFEKKPALFRLEFAIYYVTFSGKHSRKVYHISERLFLPGEQLTICRKQSFTDRTTRRHFKGKHRLVIMANSKIIAENEFMVR